MLLLSLLTSSIFAQTCINHKIDLKKPYYSQGLRADYNPNNIVQDNGKGIITLQLSEKTGGTRLSVKDYIQYGNITTTFKISPGENVVFAFILMAVNGDEIDFEFVQNTPIKTRTIQTNFFYKGKAIFDVNAKMYNSTQPLADNFNKYGINWTPDYYEWMFNDVSLRRLYRNQTKDYPDSLSQIQFGIWNAPPSSWAGSGVKWMKNPFEFQISEIEIKCESNSTWTESMNSSLKTLNMSYITYVFIVILLF